MEHFKRLLTADTVTYSSPVNIRQQNNIQVLMYLYIRLLYPNSLRLSDTPLPWSTAASIEQDFGYNGLHFQPPDLLWNEKYFIHRWGLTLLIHTWFRPRSKCSKWKLCDYALLVDIAENSSVDLALCQQTLDLLIPPGVFHHPPPQDALVINHRKGPPELTFRVFLAICNIYLSFEEFYRRWKRSDCFRFAVMIIGHWWTLAKMADHLLVDILMQLIVKETQILVQSMNNLY